MLADSHCHLYLEKFDIDRDQVIKRALAAGVTRLLVPGMDLSSSRRAVELAEGCPQIYAAVGFHPTDIEKMDESGFDEICNLATHSKVVALGEIGLDYYWVKEKDKQHRQRDGLRRQLQLARELNKPVILHLREHTDAQQGACAEDMLQILGDWVPKLRTSNAALASQPGVLHSFSGSLQTAQRALDLGFFIGITGPITFEKANQRRQITAALPLDHLLVETDAPYLAPVPHRGKRNEPAFVTHIADKIAEIQSRSPLEVATLTSKNAARLFAWEESD